MKFNHGVVKTDEKKSIGLISVVHHKSQIKAKAVHETG